MSQEISIFIVEDHQLLVDAWKSFLNNESGFKVCGASGSVEKAIDFISDLRPDIVLMDINLTDGSGIDLTQIVTNKLPKTRVIGLSIHDDMAFVKQFFSNGARGYLTKNVPGNELIIAINEVIKGNTYVCKEIIDRKFFNDLNGQQSKATKELTPKEIEVVKFIANGLTSKKIAEKLFVSVRTVETHRHNILKKLDLSNTALLCSYAKDKGYV